MSTFSVASLYQWPRHCTPKARTVVLGILNASKTPLATKDIYKLVVKPRLHTPAPHHSQEIRSMRYLKTVVLRDLAAQNRVEKVRTKTASFTAWLWQPKTAPVPVTTQTQAQAPTTTTVPSPTGLTPASVGVGEDWSHLNKRRQRARKNKVERDVRWMHELQERNKVSLRTSSPPRVQ